MVFYLKGKFNRPLCLATWFNDQFLLWEGCGFQLYFFVLLKLKMTKYHSLLLHLVFFLFWDEDKNNFFKLSNL